MIYLILVSVFLVGCKAVELDQEAHLEIDAESVARWAQLHKQLYGPVSTAGDDPSPSEIRDLLQEMSSIEKTDAYRNGIERFTELKGDSINHYKYLVIKFYQANLVPKAETTITNALLLTFDYEANDCTTEYFELLEDVLETFKDTTIAVALQNNAESQYVHCWPRLTDTITTNCMLLGLRVRSTLDRLTSIVNPDESKLLKFTANSSMLAFRTQSIDVSTKIVEFLRGHFDQRQDVEVTEYNEVFEREVKRPCEILVNATMHVMHILINIWSILKVRKPEILTNDQIKILNRYNLCRRISGDSDFIKTNVAKYSLLETRLNRNLTNQELMKRVLFDVHDVIQTRSSKRHRSKRKTSLSKVSTDPNLSIPSDGVELITQHLPEVTDPDGGSSEADEPPSIASAPKARPGRLLDLNKESPTVVWIEDGVGKTRNKVYPVSWSDKRISMETKEFLLKEAPVMYEDFRLKRKARNQVNYRVRKSIVDKFPAQKIIQIRDYKKRPKMIRPANVPSADPNFPRVVNIRRTKLRGPHVKYPTEWSNKTETMESKDFLVTNYQDIWEDFRRRIKSEDQAKHENGLPPRCERSIFVSQVPGNQRKRRFIGPLNRPERPIADKNLVSNQNDSSNPDIITDSVLESQEPIVDFAANETSRSN